MSSTSRLTTLLTISGSTFGIIDIFFSSGSRESNIETVLTLEPEIMLKLGLIFFVEIIFIF